MELNTIEILFIMMCTGLASWFIGYVLGTLTSLKIRMEELETIASECDNERCINYIP